MSKSAVYNHYRGKDDFLISVLEFIISEYQSRIETEETARTIAYLQSFHHIILSEELRNSSENGDVSSNSNRLNVVIEIKAQALHNEIFRNSFQKRAKHVIQWAVFRQTTTDSISL